VPALSASVDLVLGIKEPPVQRVHELLDLEPGRNRRWMVFSHTHKGQVSTSAPRHVDPPDAQPYNTPLLSAFADPHRSQTLIDYELLTAPEGSQGALKRVAAFGWYAGGASTVVRQVQVQS
jgi:alpha-aminoadipic semialdehyde synthase